MSRVSSLFFSRIRGNREKSRENWWTVTPGNPWHTLPDIAIRGNRENFKENRRKSRNIPENVGNLGNSRKIQENPKEIQAIQENHRNPSQLQNAWSDHLFWREKSSLAIRKLPKPHSGATLPNWPKSIKINKKSLKITKNQWIIKNQWKSLKINRNH